jgi:hypothetical protein
MRTHVANLTSSLRGLCTGLATTGLLLATNTPGLSQALPPSPVGTWDFVVSGSQQGIAFLTFNKDFSISGYEVITMKASVPPSVDMRNPSGGDTGRGGLVSTNTPTVSSNLFFFGFGPIEGTWQLDDRGRTVGFFTEGSELGSEALSASFVATVRPGKRMTFKAVDSPNPALLGTQPRTSVFQGIPFAAGAALDGSYTGNGAVTSTTVPDSSQRFVEFFALTNAVSLLSDPSFLATYPDFWPLTNSPAVSNSYFLSGSGPGYTNFGLAVLSGQKKLAIASLNFSSSTASNSILRSEAGPFNAVRLNGSLVGIDDNSDKINLRVAHVTP